MLNINIFDDFISVGAKSEILKYADAIMPEMGYEVFKSGYDIDDFIKHVVNSSPVKEQILDSFTFDSEYCEFNMYYNKPKGTKVTDDDIKACTDLVMMINHAIRNEYMNAISNVNTNVEIYDTRNN